MSIEDMTFPHKCAPIDYDAYLDKILHTIYRVGKAASSKEIAAKESSLGNYICIGRGCSFLGWLGMVKGKQSPFNLTEDGRKIAIAIENGKLDDALEVWKRVLEPHNLFSELKTYLKTQGGNSGTPVGFGEHLNQLSGKNLDYPFVRDGGKRLCALLAGKELLVYNREQDKISLPSDEKKPPIPPLNPNISSTMTIQNAPPQTPATPPQAMTVHLETKPSAVPTSTLTTPLPCNINISVEAKDPDSIKQVINLIRELVGKKTEP